MSECCFGFLSSAKAPVKDKAKVTYRSTRGGVSGLSFEQALFEGLAPDGGLLVPDKVPDASSIWKTWKGLKFHELAYEIASLYSSRSEIPAADLRNLLRRSYASFEHPEVIPCTKVDDFHVMELFHGPTLSFKDVALQALGNFYEYFLQKTSRKLTIICATSGDTGSAALCGMGGKENVNCFVLFPEGRVSSIQQQQMTSVLDPNAHCLAVQGTFDDCQNIVKGLFCDLDLKKKYGLGAVNSINWARIMFQITYYFYTYFKLCPNLDRKMSFSVPTGNFGDILAGYYAKRMGLPVENLIVATNSNDILHRFFTTGKYEKGTVFQTSSPSMDIGISSNFERYLFYLFDEDSEKLADAMASFKQSGKLEVSSDLLERARKDFASAAASDKVIQDTIKSYQEKHDYLLCPHTACGVYAVEQVRDGMQWNKDSHEIVVLGTAHPAKFGDTVQEATGIAPSLPPALARIQGAPTRMQVVPNSEAKVQEALEKGLAANSAGGDENVSLVSTSEGGESD